MLIVFSHAFFICLSSHSFLPIYGRGMFSDNRDAVGIPARNSRPARDPVKMHRREAAASLRVSSK